MDGEGFLNVGGLRLFYRSVGEGRQGTLLGLHGGPGGSYDYLLPLFDLADEGYRVVLYDQSGGGKSEVPKNRAHFTIERFVEEVEGVRRALKLSKIHLYGHSWGGMLAQEYALKYPKNLSSLILSGTSSSIPLLESELEGLVQAMGEDLKRTIAKYENEGDFENPEYVKAIDEFNRRYQCRLDPWPEPVKYAFEHFSKPVGDTMFGPNLVKVSGNMRYWDVTERLSVMRVPCLIICGEHDFLTPRLHRKIHSVIKGSKIVVLKDASHAAMWEAREAYIKKILDFLGNLS